MNPLHVVGVGPGEQRRDSDSGAYQLIMSVVRPALITVGSLGVYTFARGTYLYTGRALKGLNKRIERHQRKEKRMRWHIDYLLEHARIDGIQVYAGKASDECLINNETRTALQGVFPVKGFGSSDCRCTSHLIFVPESHPWDREALNSISQRLNAMKA